MLETRAGPEEMWTTVVESHSAVYVSGPSELGQGEVLTHTTTCGSRSPSLNGLNEKLVYGISLPPITALMTQPLPRGPLSHYSNCLLYSELASRRIRDQERCHRPQKNWGQSIFKHPAGATFFSLEPKNS